MAWLYVLVAVPLVFGVAYTRNFDLIKTLDLRAALSVAVLFVVVETFFLPSLRTDTQSAPRSGEQRPASRIPVHLARITARCFG